MTAARIVEFSSDDGPIFVEIQETVAGPLPASNIAGVAGQAEKSFNDTVAGIRPIAQAVIGQLVDLGPQQAEVEFGVKFSAKAGLILASAASEGHCKIRLTWTKPTS